MILKVRRLNMGETGLFRLKLGILTGLVTGVLGLYATSSRADDGPPASSQAAEENVGMREGAQLDARASYALGQQAYQQKAYAEAERYFKRAHSLKPHPTTLKMIAECRLGQGDILSAAAMMGELLKDDTYPDQKRLKKRYLRLKTKLSDSQLEQLPNLVVSDLVKPDDGKTTGETETSPETADETGDSPPPVEVPAADESAEVPVPAVLPAAAADGSADTDAAVGAPAEPEAGANEAGAVAGEDADVQKADETANLTETTDAVPAEMAGPVMPEQSSADTSVSTGMSPRSLGEQSEELPRAFWAASAVAGIGLVAGTVFGTMALRDEKDYQDAPNSSTRDSGRRAAVIADVSFGLALAAAVSATLFLISDRKKKKQKKGGAAGSGAEVSVGPSVIPAGAGVAAGISFR
jgi:hypothetical protein